MNITTSGLDIGFWFPRPERGARLAEELRRLGHSVTIYHDQAVPGDQAYVQKVDYSFISGIRRLRSLSHDVMYTSRSFKPVLQLYANRCLGGSPYVYTINGVIWEYYNDRASTSKLGFISKFAYPTLFRLAVSGAGIVVANSSFLAEQIKLRIPKESGKIVSIYNGINYEGIESGKPNLNAWLPGNTRVLSIVTLNLLRKTEGVLLLAKAFEILCRKHENLTYLIAAKSENTAAVERVRKALNQLSCANRVQVEVNRKDIPDLLATANLFLYATPPNSSDSLPRALLETQAAGVPTVTTSTTGCGEAVLDGKTGLVVDYDSNSIAEAASELLNDGVRSRILAKRGMQSVRERFSWTQMAKSYEAIFLSISDQS